MVCALVSGLKANPMMHLVTKICLLLEQRLSWLRCCEVLDGSIYRNSKMLVIVLL